MLDILGTAVAIAIVVGGFAGVLYWMSRQNDDLRNPDGTAGFDYWYRLERLQKRQAEERKRRQNAKR